MTISSTNRLAGPFIGNGTVGMFPFTFKVFVTSDVLVAIAYLGAQTTLTLTSDYSVALNADQDNSPGGSITLNPASVTPGIVGGLLATGATLVVSSQVPELQQTTLTNFGGFFPTVINAALDRLTILVQQIQQFLGRGITAPLTDPTGVNYGLPPAPVRANQTLIFDSSGNVTTGAFTSAPVGSVLQPFLASTSLTQSQLLLTGRRFIAAATSFYVSTSGSDANDGTTLATAWRTIQNAITQVANTTIIAAPITIYVSDGTYNENINLAQFISANAAQVNCPTIMGNPANNTGVIINATTGTGVTGVAVTSPWVLQNIKFTSAAGPHVVADWGSTIYLKNPNFGACPGSNQMVAEWGSKIELLTGGYTISGSAASHAFAIRGGAIVGQGGVVTITGTPAFTTVTQSTDPASMIDLTSNNTFSGSATGSQATLVNGGRVIRPDLLPGSTAVLNNDYTEAEVLTGAAVTVSLSGTPVNIVSLSIPPGEWDVWGQGAFKGAAGTTVGYAAFSISSVSATINNLSEFIKWLVCFNGMPFNYSSDLSVVVGPARVRLAVTTTLYLVAQTSSSANLTAYAKLKARRITDY